MESFSSMEAKYLWGNFFFDHIISEACGNSGGILCLWDTNLFQKDQHIISDNFVALYGTWVPNNLKLLLISVYAPQSGSSKRILWNYLDSLITNWNGESLIMGDFNEVRTSEERWGSCFNVQGAASFNSFISNVGLLDIQLEGYSFTWAHPSATKMSKLDRFLMTNGFLSAFPHISALCLDRHLSDHRPILLKEIISDYGPTPFRFYHSWLELPGFDDMISKSWNSFSLDDSNGMIRFKKKLQLLKKVIREWTRDARKQQVGQSIDLKAKLCDIDKELDQGGVSDDILLSRMELMKHVLEMEAPVSNDEIRTAVGSGRGKVPLDRWVTFEFFPFLPNRQILDGPFIINEILARCKAKKQQAMIFKPDYPLSSIFSQSKAGIPSVPFLFLLIMEAFHLSFNRATDAGIFKGLKIDSSLSCFSLLSGMSINILKSHLLGFGILENCVVEAAKSIGCSTMRTPFRYLGILVGDNMSSKKAWDETIIKMRKRLSKWKINTLSIGGRLTLLKSVLGSTPIYDMTIFKVPKSILNTMESIQRRFFNGVKEGDRKISWTKWHTVLAAKKHGGLGVSSFYALNRALLFKWVWRFLSQDNSLWYRVISAIHGVNCQHLAAYNSTWSTIIKEINFLKDKGIDLIAHCKIRVGNGIRTSFWNDLWIGESILKLSFPRLYALEDNKDSSVADKINDSITSSFRRFVRGGVESFQLDHLKVLLEPVILSNMEDRWYWDLNGDGVFRVKDARNLIDEFFLPNGLNLARRNVYVPSLDCPLCDQGEEDTSHLFFGCSAAKEVMKLICQWWDLDYQLVESYEEWFAWFKSIRLEAKSKDVLEGVFFVSWWSVWFYRNQLLFADASPRKSSIFDDITLRSYNWCLARGNSTLSWVSWL
ncbi:RNA-directed DNA polymerase, eukaryota [Tanacetum coccineum]